MNADGTNQRQLTNSPALDALPSFSPDGRSIVFVSDRTAKDNREFFRMTASGGSQHRLLASRLWDMSPDWGPSLGRAGCTITGTINPDVLAGTPGRDVICGLGGRDAISGLGGNDRLLGEAGDDSIRGGAGADLIDGGTGNDHLVGSAGRDTIRGGPGADFVDARDGGTDTLDGGASVDRARIDRKLDKLSSIEKVEKK
jgi:Ca2+-binding RTX toxin-like protein